MIRITIAPMVEPMMPALCPWPYQPSAPPSRLATSAPATPRPIVIKIPPGSLPGMMNLASAPATSPMTAVQIRFTVSSFSRSDPHVREDLAHGRQHAGDVRGRDLEAGDRLLGPEDNRAMPRVRSGSGPSGQLPDVQRQV